MKKLKTGFTLVELLVVISIISTLVTMAVVSFRSSQFRARDVQRKSDLRQYQNALELYANDNGGLYPVRNVLESAYVTLCSDLGLSNCPQDPRGVSDSTLRYNYIAQGHSSIAAGQPGASEYLLTATLEVTQEYWIVCANGSSGAMPQTTTISSSVCPF